MFVGSASKTAPWNLPSVDSIPLTSLYSFRCLECQHPHFFERAIFGQFLVVYHPTLRFFAVSRFLKPAHLGNLELTGTEKKASRSKQFLFRGKRGKRVIQEPQILQQRTHKLYNALQGRGVNFEKFRAIIFALHFVSEVGL